jgi:hypothetical protein
MKKSQEELTKEKEWLFSLFIDNESISNDSLKEMFKDTDFKEKNFIRLAQIYTSEGSIVLNYNSGTVSYSLSPSGKLYLEHLITQKNEEKKAIEQQNKDREIQVRLNASTLLTNEKSIKHSRFAIVLSIFTLIVSSIFSFIQIKSKDKEIQEITIELHNLEKITNLKISKLEEENIKIKSIQNALLMDKNTK